MVADSTGLFPAIYYDPAITYRAQLYTAAGGLVDDTDPVAAPYINALASITASMLASGAAAGNLGYASLNKAGDTATNLLLASTAIASTSAGYLGAPVNEQDGGYTFALSDAGGMVRCNSAAAETYTITAELSGRFARWNGDTDPQCRRRGSDRACHVGCLSRQGRRHAARLNSTRPVCAGDHDPRGRQRLGHVRRGPDVTGAVLAAAAGGGGVGGNGGSPNAMAWSNPFGETLASTQSLTVSGIGGGTAPISATNSGPASLSYILNGASTSYTGAFSVADGDTLAWAVLNLGVGRLAGTVVVTSTTFAVDTFSYVVLGNNNL